MDSTWDIRTWIPSVGEDLVTNWPRPNAQRLSRLSRELQNDSNHIRKLPYDPAGWRIRASVLINLGYPELGASDAYKSISLFTAGVERRGEDQLGEDSWAQGGRAAWDRGWSKKPWDDQSAEAKETFTSLYFTKELLVTYRILLDALKALMDFHSIITIGYEALQKYPKDPYIVKIITEFEVYYSKKYNYTPKPEDSVVDDAGRKIAVRYPWSPVQFHTRSQEVINQINAEISTATHDLLEVRESQVGGENTGCLGVFAKQDIAAGTEVFNSLGPINVRSDQMEVNICYNCFGPNSKLRFTIGCCHTLRLCSPECQDIAMNTYHKALCGKDFKGLYEKAKAGIYKGMGSDEAPPFASLLWLRILACCVAEKEVHPLEGRTFGRLGSVQSVSVRWTLMGKVVAPIQVLQGLGIDVFADGRYDQWVLEEIWARLSGNYVNEEGAFEPSLDTVYSMFNHSCELNHQLTKGDSTVAAAPSQSSRFQPTAPSPLRTSLLAPVETGSRKIFLAKREMERDSEVFVSYVDFRDQMGKNEREKELEHWVGSGGCGCTRCKRE